MTDLKAEYIKCRDALACAINWLEPPEPPDVKMRIPADKLDWLNNRLHEATLLVDRIADDEGFAETPEEWGEVFITRDIEGLNKTAFRVVTRKWDDENNDETHAWVVDIVAAPDGDLILTKRRIDPVPWKD